MCGFVGITAVGGLPFTLDRLRQSRDTLAHRGPDDAGERYDASTYLGFRRLAILDTSKEGNQPMVSDDGLIWLVLNGEVYNFVELREQLSARGHRFRSRSDAEVVLRLYEERGTAMFSDLIGMFACAIYDGRQRQLILARDRLGQKPLFYAKERRAFSFASELRALRSLFGRGRISAKALSCYLRLGWVPSGICIQEGVQKLPPASWVAYDLESGRTKEPTFYWSLPEPMPDFVVEEGHCVDRIHELLWDATRIRLRSDVPLGTFLSGGIDSGLVTAAAAEQIPAQLTSLTVSFPEWKDNEWPLARETAVRLGVRALHRDLSARGAGLLPAVMGHFDEPFSDTSALPTSLVCKEAREHIKVALSGDGGDELFAGYTNHVRAWQWRHLEHLPISLRRWLSRRLARRMPPDSRTQRFLTRLGYPVGTWGMGAKLYPFEEWIQSCVRPEFRFADLEETVEGDWAERAAASPIDQAQRVDLSLYLVDDILVKVDRMSMRHSLEVRSPFLDHRLVEYALSIPARLRVRLGHNKHLLRLLAKQHLPAAVCRASKRGFGLPVRAWLFEERSAAGFAETLLDGGCDDLFVPGGGERLLSMARDNPALVSAVYRMLAYRWWRDAAGSGLSS